MTFLPIVERELRQAARRRGTYWVRLAVAVSGLLIGGWLMLMMRRQAPAELGKTLFVCLAVIAYCYSLFVGVFRTADCLSEEKREGTLGLLFLTDLKGYDIVFGKLAASSLNAFYGMLAIFPVMAIPLLVGGVTVGEFWRVVAASLNMLFFSLAVGMFASAISRDERRALVVALLVVLFSTVGLYIIAIISETVLKFRDSAGYILFLSPAFSAGYAFDGAYNAKTTILPFHPFLPSMLSIHALSWLLLLAASWAVPRTWQDKALTGTQLRRREQWLHLQLGSPEWRRRFRQRLLELNPIYWLLARQRTKPLAVWALIVLAGLIWTLGLVFNPRGWKDEAAYFITAILLHTVLKIWVATEACRRFSMDRQSGALELLLSTPIPVKDIVRGQWMALERQFAGPVVVVLLADLIFLLASRRDAEVAPVWIAGMLVFFVDLLALGWLGMWRGLNSRRPNRAAAATLVRVLVLPWGIFMLVLTLGLMFDSFGRRGSAWSGTSFLFLWVAISLCVNAVFALPARRLLFEEFRRVATERFNPGAVRSE